MMVGGIYKGDCLELIKKIPKGGVNVCITDPPYGIDYQSARRTDKTTWKPKIMNDDAPFIDWIKPTYERLSDGGRLICFYRWDVQEEFLAAIKSAGFTVKSQGVWDKEVHGMGDLKGELAPQHELFFYATKGRYEFQGPRPKTIYRCQRISGNDLIHPNEKPVNLLRAMIRDISQNHEIIFDPFGGSFSTYRAALKEGRKCISFELSDHYFAVGKNSLLNLDATLNLF